MTTIKKQLNNDQSNGYYKMNINNNLQKYTYE